MSTSTKFYILTIVLALIAFSGVEELGLHPITVAFTIAALVTAYLGWRTEDAGPHLNTERETNHDHDF